MIIKNKTRQKKGEKKEITKRKGKKKTQDGSEKKKHLLLLQIFKTKILWKMFESVLNFNIYVEGPKTND